MNGLLPYLGQFTLENEGHEGKDKEQSGPLSPSDGGVALDFHAGAYYVLLVGYDDEFI